MTSDRYMKRNHWILGATLALAATTVVAATSAPQASVPETSVKLTVADSTETMAEAPGSTTPRGYPSSEAGVRRAAAQGLEALRRYI